MEISTYVLCIRRMLKYCYAIPTEELRTKIREWFSLNRDGYRNGFSINLKNRVNLVKKQTTITGTWAQKVSLYKDILRRMREGKFEKRPDSAIKWYCPIYMLTKLRSFAKPELG